MANQVVVSPLLQLVFDKLADLIEKDFSVASSVQKLMKKLSKTLSRIKYFVIDAEEKQVSNLEIRDWLQELKEATCTVEDVLEEWECQGLLGVAPEKSNIDFVTKVTESLTELYDIANESQRFHLQKGGVDNRETNFLGRETGSLLTEQVYGRDKDREKLVNLLLAQYQYKKSHPQARKLPNKVNRMGDISVCPILGIGGMGKTTLAKLVYNDEQVQKHFEVRAWTCVSDDFDVNRIIRGIISSLLRTACVIEELDALQRCLQEKLVGKRFLLVLDDVWQEGQDEWNELKGTLACGAEGSCVIVTTRLETVASITATLPPCRLEGLSENDCCCLFKQRAFGLEEKERPDLMEIGKEIVKKCKGVPLAAKALGASLRFKREPRQWSIVKNSEIWQLEENGILPALRLSFNHLSSQLRQCFVYCSLFEKDHEINRKELIQLWMANGFVQSKGRMEELENAGNEFFEALLWRSFFQDVQKDKDGNIETCKMHDLVHDLACDIAGNEYSIVDGERVKNITRRTRHVTLFSTKELSSHKDVHPSLRSLILVSKQSSRIIVGKKVSTQELQFIFSHLLCLRALDLRDASIEVLPDCIGDMKHLRYINLSLNSIQFLPESMCKLINLETLNLASCFYLETLPRDMSEMGRLRHLDIRGCDRLAEMPLWMGKLTSLQILSKFIVGLESGRGINELGGLNNIGGKLEISGLENVRDLTDAKEANLINKENLCSLKLLWLSSDRDLSDSGDAEMGSGSGHEEMGCDNGDEMGCDNGDEMASDKGDEDTGTDRGDEEMDSGDEEMASDRGDEDTGTDSEDEEMGSDGGDEDTGTDSEDEEMGSDGGDDDTGLDSVDEETNIENELLHESATHEEVMEGLQPPPNLRKLVVRSYCGVSFPNWLLPKLVKLKLSWCTRCEHVSPLKRLPLLKVLKIDRMDSLKFIVEGDATRIGGFMSLEELVLESMLSLEGWSSSSYSLSQTGASGDEHHKQAAEAEAVKLLFPCLKRLTLRDCPELRGDPLPSSVESVTVEHCSETVLGSFQNLPCLSSIQIEWFDELECFPRGMLRNLPALKQLSILSCSNVKALPDRLRNLPSLTSLRIEDCEYLKRFPELNKSCLVDLYISDCPEMEFSMEEDFQHLVVLRQLSLYNLPRLAGFPEGIKQAVMLQYLCIKGCSEEVMDLPDWIGTLTSLEYLAIEGCKNRKVLPEGMQHLTALRKLTISGCDSELEKRCKKDTGEDWSKIAHVLYVDIRKAYSIT